jgi:perosamine synthetase
MGEIEAVAATLRSGWLTTGVKAQAFESAFADRIGVTHALAVSSATGALHLALDAMGVRRGDEVVVPTYTFTACGEVCAYVGARVVLADVGSDYLLSPQQLEPVLSARTKVVMPVHIGGQAVNVDRLRAITSDRVRFVEDAAHALPADVGGVPTGKLGDAGAFSFYATKTLTTGEGGMLVTDDDDIATRARLMRLHGIDADAWNRYGVGGKWFYTVEQAGYKYNLTDIAAAMGLAQLSRLDEMAASRRRIAGQYDRLFSDSELIDVPPRRQEDGHAWHLYAVALRLDHLTVGRGEIIEALAEAGIGASVHFIPLHLHPYYQRQFGYKPGDFPIAEMLYERTISLPIWPDMTDEQVQRVAETLLELTHGSRRPVET